jgi:hypothetical protein
MRLGWFAVVCAVIGVLPCGARAEPLGSVTEPVVTRGVDGFGPDAQLVGGLGFGFERKLDNYFLARARLGALYATAPWIVNLGLTAEVGAIAGLGWGAELELSRGGTFYGNAGVARVDQARWLAHLGLGFTIFGLEWQHVFDGPKPHDALLFEVRLPLGLWWLHKRQEKAEAQDSAPAPPPQVKPRTAMPRGATTHPTPGATAAAANGGAPSAASSVGAPDAAASGAAASVAAPSGAAASGVAPGAAASGGKTRAVTEADIAAREAELASRLAEAGSAREKGDRLAEAFALSRAYALRPDPAVALQLAAAELALGKPRSALADWQRAGDPEQLSAADRGRALQLRQQLNAALAQLRLELTGSVSDRDAVWIDGALEPLATQGYDVPLDPGAHTLQVRRGERVIIERTLDARAGALQRMSIELPRE